MVTKRRPQDPAEKKAKTPRGPRDSGVIWEAPPDVKTGSYPAVIGVGAGVKGKTHPLIAEDSQGWSGFGINPRVRRKPQEAHTPGNVPGEKLSSRNKIKPSTTALIRTSGTKKK